jgi:hypothetical protein
MMTVEEALDLKSDQFLLGSSHSASPPPPPPPPTPTAAASAPPPGATPLERLDRSLTSYIARSLDRVRDAFVEELTTLLHNTAEEDSAISAFLLGLPRDMEESIAAEIGFAKSSTNFQRDCEQLLSAVDAQLETLWRVVPPRRGKGEPAPTLRGLSSIVLSTQAAIGMAIENMLSEFMAERSPPLSNPYESLKTESRPFQRLEVEANSRKLDVECEFVDAKKKQLEELERERREAQLHSDKVLEDPNDVLVKKLAAVADQIPNSQFRAAVANLSALRETAKRSCEEVRTVRTQFELEADRIVFAYRQAARPAPQLKRQVALIDGGDQGQRENVLDEAIRQLDALEQKRRKRRPRRSVG